MTQRVSLDQARERRRAYFYHWFGKHWAAITERKDGSNYRSPFSFSLSVSLFLFLSFYLFSFLSVFSSSSQKAEAFVSCCVAYFEFRHKTVLKKVL